MTYDLRKHDPMTSRKLPEPLCPRPRLLHGNNKAPCSILERRASRIRRGNAVCGNTRQLPGSPGQNSFVPVAKGARGTDWGRLDAGREACRKFAMSQISAKCKRATTPTLQAAPPLRNLYLSKTACSHLSSVCFRSWRLPPPKDAPPGASASPWRPRLQLLLCFLVILTKTDKKRPPPLGGVCSVVPLPVISGLRAEDAEGWRERPGPPSALARNNHAAPHRGPPCGACIPSTPIRQAGALVGPSVQGLSPSRT